MVEHGAQAVSTHSHHRSRCAESRCSTTRWRRVSYEFILKAIAAGHHERETIASYATIKSTALSHYLPRLLDLQFVERRIPATVPLADLKTSRKTRYYLRDPFLRFYSALLTPIYT